MNCPLCNLEMKTRWWYEDELWILCECLTCKVPMFVFKKHEQPTEQQVARAVLMAMARYPGKIVDHRMRAVPNHYHFHVR